VKMRDFTKYFRNEQEEAEAQAVDMAREVLDWVGQAYHAKFDQWLESEASKPLDTSKPHAELIQSAVRANTLKEIRQYLSRLKQGALDAMERAKEV